MFKDFDCVLYATPDGDIMAKSKLWKIDVWGHLQSIAVTATDKSKAGGNADRVAPASIA